MAGLNPHHPARVGAMPGGWYRKIVSPAPPFHPAGPAMATLLMGPAGSVGSNRNPVPMTPAFLSLYVPPAMGMAGAVPNATAVGTSRAVVVPSPSRPRPLKPQQYAVAVGVTPQVCAVPALRTANVRPPTTGVGTSRVVVVPSPTCPLPLKPQQYAAPVGVTPQV